MRRILLGIVLVFLFVGCSKTKNEDKNKQEATKQASKKDLNELVEKFAKRGKDSKINKLMKGEVK